MDVVLLRNRVKHPGFLIVIIQMRNLTNHEPATTFIITVVLSGYYGLWTSDTVCYSIHKLTQWDSLPKKNFLRWVRGGFG